MARRKRLFAQVVSNHIGHERVHALVIGDARARSIYYRHIAALIGIYQPRNTEHGVTSEYKGVNKVVVNTPIDDVHTLKAFGCAHIDEAIVHQQVLPLHQFGADLAGQEHMLIKGGVVYAGS